MGLEPTRAEHNVLAVHCLKRSAKNRAKVTTTRRKEREKGGGRGKEREKGGGRGEGGKKEKREGEGGKKEKERKNEISITLHEPSQRI